MPEEHPVYTHTKQVLKTSSLCLIINSLKKKIKMTYLILPINTDHPKKDFGWPSENILSQKYSTNNLKYVKSIYTRQHLGQSALTLHIKTKRNNTTVDSCTIKIDFCLTAVRISTHLSSSFFKMIPYSSVFLLYQGSRVCHSNPDPPTVTPPLESVKDLRTQFPVCKTTQKKRRMLKA